MTNEYTITLNRQDISRLLLACTSIIVDSRFEMTNDPKCPEYRKTEVLPATIKMWQKIHDNLEKQLQEQDAKHNYR